MLVSVGEGAVCLSSCVYILAGGVQRAIYGEVGIHSPYDVSETRDDYAVTKRKFDSLRSQVKSYLAEMNVPDSLYDAMLRIPSHQIHILSEEELYTYGLSTEDPVYREASDIAQAKKLGVSRKEYLRRKAQRDELCVPIGNAGDLRGYLKCSSRIMGYDKKNEIGKKTNR